MHTCGPELDGVPGTLLASSAEQGDRGQQHHRRGMRWKGEAERRPERDPHQPVVDERDPGGCDQGSDRDDAEEPPDIHDVGHAVTDVPRDQDGHDDRLGQVGQAEEGRDQDRPVGSEVGERESEEQEPEDDRPVSPRRSRTATTPMPAAGHQAAVLPVA
jgi:hypothetical protein